MKKEETGMLHRRIFFNKKGKYICMLKIHKIIITYSKPFIKITKLCMQFPHQRSELDDMKALSDPICRSPGSEPEAAKAVVEENLEGISEYVLTREE